MAKREERKVLISSTWIEFEFRDKTLLSTDTAHSQATPTHRHYGRAHKAASAPTPVHTEHTAHVCHTSTLTEALLPDTLNTVTLQIIVFTPHLRNIHSRNRIAYHFKLGSLHAPHNKPSQKAPLPDMAPGSAVGAPPQCLGSAGAPGIPGWTCHAGCHCELA